MKLSHSLRQVGENHSSRSPRIRDWRYICVGHIIELGTIHNILFNSLQYFAIVFLQLLLAYVQSTVLCVKLCRLYQERQKQSHYIVDFLCFLFSDGLCVLHDVENLLGHWQSRVGRLVA